MDIFNCGICLERYDEEEKTVPRTLTECGHTICELCALKILKNSKVVCPFDRIESQVPDGNIKSLKKNFGLYKTKNVETERDGKYEAEKALGIPCDEDGSHIAVLYCTVCKVHYCERCSIRFHSSKTQSSHKIVKVPEKPEPLLYMDDLECGICRQPYDLEKRLPRILSKCLHEICESCALEKLRDTGVECPCGKVTHVMGGNVEFLKVNYKLKERIYMLKLEEEREKKNSVIYKNEIALGIPCDEDRSHIAILYCTVCKVHYCEKCSKTSHGSVTLAAHEMVKVTDKPEPLLYCPLHSYNVAEFFCLEKNCEIKNKVTCANCYLCGAHKGHEYKTIDEVFDVKMEETSELLKQTNIKIMLVKDCDNCIGELPETINEDHEYIDAKNKIDGIFEERLEELKNWKESNMEILEKETKAKNESNKKEKEYFSSKLEELETLKLECLNKKQLKKTEYFEKFEDIEVIKEKLESIEIRKSAKRRMKAVVEYPNVITFDKQTSKGNIVFVTSTFLGIQNESVRIKQLGGIEYELWKFQLNGHHIQLFDRKMLKSCKNIEIKLLVIFDRFTFDELRDILGEKAEKLKIDGNIIVGLDYPENDRHHWIEEFPKMSQHFQVPIMYARQQETFMDHILKGNYLDNSFFERYIPKKN